MKLLRKHTKPLNRQIHEAVEIDNSTANIIMNSKSEWNGSRLPTITLEIGAQVLTGDYRGQVTVQQGPHGGQEEGARAGDHELDPEEQEALDVTQWEDKVRSRARTTVKKSSGPRSRNENTAAAGNNNPRVAKVPRLMQDNTLFNYFSKDTSCAKDCRYDPASPSPSPPGPNSPPGSLPISPPGSPSPPGPGPAEGNNTHIKSSLSATTTSPKQHGHVRAHGPPGPPGDKSTDHKEHVVPGEEPDTTPASATTDNDDNKIAHDDNIAYGLEGPTETDATTTVQSEMIQEEDPGVEDPQPPPPPAQVTCKPAVFSCTDIRYRTKDKVKDKRTAKGPKADPRSNHRRPYGPTVQPPGELASKPSPGRSKRSGTPAVPHRKDQVQTHQTTLSTLWGGGGGQTRTSEKGKAKSSQSCWRMGQCRMQQYGQRLVHAPPPPQWDETK